MILIKYLQVTTIHHYYIVFKSQLYTITLQNLFQMAMTFEIRVASPQNVMCNLRIVFVLIFNKSLDRYSQIASADSTV